MDSFIRIASLSHKLHLGNPRQTVEEMISLMNEAGKYDPDVYLFPADSFYRLSVGNAGVSSFCGQRLRELCEGAFKIQ